MSIAAIGATALNVATISSEVAGLRPLADPALSPVFAGIAGAQTVYRDEDETIAEEEALATSLVRAAALVTTTSPSGAYQRRPLSERRLSRLRNLIERDLAEEDDRPVLGTRFDSAA